MVAAGTWQMDSFTSSDKTKPMFVTGKATLYVVGNVTVSGSGYIKLLPGASLTLIVGGNNPVISGVGIINSGFVNGVNDTTQAASFTYLGLPSSTKLTYSGSTAFVGTINAPQAALTISGSSGAYGAAIVNTYTSSGGSGFHYDECLGALGNSLTITGWREL